MRNLFLVTRSFCGHQNFLCRRRIKSRRLPRSQAGGATNPTLEIRSEEPVRMHQLNCAHLVESLASLGWNLKLCITQVIFELRHLRRADDRRRHAGLIRDPVERDLRFRPTELLREIDEHFEYRPVTLSEAMKDRIAGIFRRLQT